MNARSIFLRALAVALVVAGIRLLLISRWAGDAPYLDDWNGTGWLQIHAAEASPGLPWAWLVYPHAEHLLVTQRLYSLAVAALNGGQWDVRAELMIAALAWGALAAGLFAWGGRELRGWSLAAWAALVIALEAAPHAWENLLWAFQVSFVLLIGFSLLAIRCLTIAAPFSPRWLAGLACGAAACLSQASGLLALLAAALVTVVSLLFQPETRTARTVLGLVAVLALAGAAKWVLPAAAWIENLHAHDVQTWLRADVALLAWPWNGFAWAAVGVWLPAAIFVARSIFRPTPWMRHDPFWLALIAWSFAMIAASAWARGTMLVLGPPPSRYGDVLAVGLLVNAFLVLRWAQAGVPSQRFRTVAAVAWLGLGVAGVGLTAVYLDQHGTPASTINGFSRRDFTASRSIQADAVRTYERTHDQAVLVLQPPIYPNAVHLAELIDRLHSAHRWPATLDSDQTRDRPLLSRFAQTTGIWARGVLLIGALLGGWVLRRQP